MFIISKLESWDWDNVQGALESSLKNLKLDYVDMYMTHGAIPKINPETMVVAKYSLFDVWRQMEHLYNSGLCRSIAVG